MQDALFEIDLDSSDMEPAMLKAAKSYLNELRKEKLIDGTHILACQLVLSLAEAIGKAAAKGQASAMSFASKELREAMAMLPKKTAVDSFEQLMTLMLEGPPDKKDPLYA